MAVPLRQIRSGPAPGGQSSAASRTDPSTDHPADQAAQAALEFALRHRAELFPDAPVVFSGGAEVDLVLEHQGCLYPIEFKAKSNPNGRDARGILAFQECFPKEQIAPGLIVCAVPEARRVAEHAWAIPWWWIG